MLINVGSKSTFKKSQRLAFAAEQFSQAHQDSLWRWIPHPQSGEFLEEPSAAREKLYDYKTKYRKDATVKIRFVKEPVDLNEHQPTQNSNSYVNLIYFQVSTFPLIT